MYPSPPWVIDALCEVIDLKGKTIWEPACGTGKMAEAIKLRGAIVHATDIHLYARAVQKFDLRRLDFLNGGTPPRRYDGIVTNPPYGERGKLAEAFIETGLRRIAEHGGFLALLLPADFDHAKSRARFFLDPRYCGLIKLTKRVKWFPNGKHGPKDNHCWHIWSQTLIGDRQSPRVWYAPRVDLRSQPTVIELARPARRVAA
jgi:hypothetical protein